MNYRKKIKATLESKAREDSSVRANRAVDELERNLGIILADGDKDRLQDIVFKAIERYHAFD
jgi:hypothetical protein